MKQDEILLQILKKLDNIEEILSKINYNNHNKIKDVIMKHLKMKKSIDINEVRKLIKKSTVTCLDIMHEIAKENNSQILFLKGHGQIPSCLKIMHSPLEKYIEELNFSMKPGQHFSIEFLMKKYNLERNDIIKIINVLRRRYKNKYNLQGGILYKLEW